MHLVHGILNIIQRFGEFEQIDYLSSYPAYLVSEKHFTHLLKSHQQEKKNLFSVIFFLLILKKLFHELLKIKYYNLLNRNYLLFLPFIGITNKIIISNSFKKCSEKIFKK